MINDGSGDEKVDNDQNENSHDKDTPPSKENRTKVKGKKDKKTHSDKKVEIVDVEESKPNKTEHTHKKHKENKEKVSKHKKSKDQSQDTATKSKKTDSNKHSTKKHKDKKDKNKDTEQKNNENHINQEEEAHVSTATENIKSKEKDNIIEKESEPQQEIESPNGLNQAKEVPTEQNTKTDRYGYIIESSITKSDKERKIESKESKKERERELKWINMLKDWDNVPKAVKERRILKGIPDGVRAAAWKRILDPKGALNPEVYQTRESIETYYNMGRQECCNTIDVDLNRTMPKVQLFKDQRVIDSLKKILYAYTNADPECGYTQGMGLYVGFLLLYMDELSSFWCFYAICKKKPYRIRSFFSPGFPRLREFEQVWNIVVQDKYPKVKKHLDEINYTDIQLGFITGWFLVFFLDSSFPPQMKLRIFDRYVGFGQMTMLSFGLVVISIHKTELMTQGIEDVQMIMNKPADSPKMKDWRKVLKVWDKKWIGKKEYAKYCKRANIKTH